LGAACSVVQIFPFKSPQKAKKAGDQVFIYFLPELESTSSNADLPAILSQFLCSSACNPSIFSLAMPDEGTWRQAALHQLSAKAVQRSIPFVVDHLPSSHIADSFFHNTRQLRGS
jgi:hypothetical protein